MNMDILEYIDEHTAIVKEDVFCMGADPVPDCAPDDLRNYR